MFLSSSVTRWQRWYRKNRERLTVRRREYRASNRELVNAWTREWRRENPGRLKREPSRNLFYRKLRRNGIDRLSAAKAAGVVLNW